jgi:hypothetical protein
MGGRLTFNQECLFIIDENNLFHHFMENLFCVLDSKLYMACVVMSVLTTIIVHPHKTIDKELP